MALPSRVLTLLSLSCLLIALVLFSAATYTYNNNQQDEPRNLHPEQIKEQQEQWQHLKIVDHKQISGIMLEEQKLRMHNRRMRQSHLPSAGINVNDYADPSSNTDPKNTPETP